MPTPQTTIDIGRVLKLLGSKVEEPKAATQQAVGSAATPTMTPNPLSHSDWFMPKPKPAQPFVSSMRPSLDAFTAGVARNDMTPQQVSALPTVEDSIRAGGMDPQQFQDLSGGLPREQLTVLGLMKAAEEQRNAAMAQYTGAMAQPETPVMSKKEALIGAAIAALAGILGARQEVLQPAAMSYVGARRDRATTKDRKAQEAATMALRTADSRAGNLDRLSGVLATSENQRATRANAIKLATMEGENELTKIREKGKIDKEIAGGRSPAGKKEALYNMYRARGDSHEEAVRKSDSDVLKDLATVGNLDAKTGLVKEQTETVKQSRKATIENLQKKGDLMGAQTEFMKSQKAYRDVVTKYYGKDIGSKINERQGRTQHAAKVLAEKIREFDAKIATGDIGGASKELGKLEKAVDDLKSQKLYFETVQANTKKSMASDSLSDADKVAMQAAVDESDAQLAYINEQIKKAESRKVKAVSGSKKNSDQMKAAIYNAGPTIKRVADWARSIGGKVDDAQVVREIRGQEGTGKMSAHSYGKAVDVAGSPTLLSKIFKEAQSIAGIKYVIYKDMIYSPTKGVHKAKGVVYHGNHVHIEEY